MKKDYEKNIEAQVEAILRGEPIGDKDQELGRSVCSRSLEIGEAIQDAISSEFGDDDFGFPEILATTSALSAVLAKFLVAARASFGSSDDFALFASSVDKLITESYIEMLPHMIDDLRRSAPSHEEFMEAMKEMGLDK